MKAWDLNALPPRAREQAAAQLGLEHRKAKRRSKYNAERTQVDGIWFDSKREAERYSELKLLRQAGEIQHFHRQVIFDLPGNSTHRVDFAVVNLDWTITYEDSKGADHADGRLRRRQVADIYGVDIELV